ncbi:MAG: IS1634 family transposase [Nitriliruptorales bacterium]|nr:IS1634 family transposase [Nitriliruptorales bacterium]
MYLRETKRRNRDGSEVAYLALAHNERDPVTGMPKARIIHNFGRADQIDRDALARLVRSISRFLDPVEAVVATAAAQTDGVDVPAVIDSRPMGVAWVADQLWQRLGIAKAIATAAAGRRVDAEPVERVLFAMVANRLTHRPLSKLAGCKWVAERVFIDGLDAVSDDACYRAMDFFGDALAELQQTVFFSVANLLNLEVDLLFFDTTSTFWQTDAADDALLPDPDPDDGDTDDDAAAVEAATRTWGHSKDHRPDLPQVVIGMAVTREGIPVRLWTFPGNTSDQTLIRTVKDDLRAWQLHRVVWVLDRGFSSEANRRYLQRAGGSYIIGEKLRGASVAGKAALSRQGRYHTVAGNLRVKQVRVDPDLGDRFVICHNPDRARRDADVREQIVARLQEEIADTDRRSARARAELAGRLKTKPAFNRFLRATGAGKLRIDRTAVRRDAHYDGKYLLRTPNQTLTPDDIAHAYKALYEAERGWRDLKTIQINLRPAFHHKDTRIQAHVQLCWLALLILRVAEIGVGDTWRNIRDELDRLHLVTLATSDGHVAQRGELRPGQRAILGALELPEPPRFFDFTPTSDSPLADPRL